MDRRKILIVEDEAIVAADLDSKLRQLGYEAVGTTASGEKAIELVSELRPDLVLMDIQLDGIIDGIEAAEIIRREQDLPVVYLTAFSDAHTLERAKLTGPFGYILKPFEERDLATQIEMALYRHHADREIRLQKEQLRVTLRSIGDAVISCDTRGNVTFINPVAEVMTGWTIGEAAGKPLSKIFSIVNELSGAVLDSPVEAVLKEGRPVALANHTNLIKRDGGTVPIEDSAAPILDDKGQVIGAVLVFRDVTAKRRSEAELRASETKFRILFETMKEGFSLYKIEYDENGRVCDLNYEQVNPAYAQQTGLEIKNVLGKSPLKMFTDIAPDWIERYMNVATTGESTHFEAWFKPLGRWFDVSLYKIGPARMAALFFNVTERKLAEEAAKKARNELEVRVQERTAELRNALEILALRNRELQDFAFVASHDLREPLRKIQSFGGLLKDHLGSNLPEQAKDYLTRMQNAAARMNELLTSLLRYSRITTHREPFKAVDLKSLIQEAAADLVIIEEKMAEVSIGELPIVEADPSQIRQLFGNLIQNAIKFNNSPRPEIKINGEIKDGLCRIYVKDNGIGFDEQFLDKIFTPFQRLHRRGEYEGMGMGLAICHKIIEVHEGNITAKSKPGDGSTFVITLPMKHLQVTNQDGISVMSG